MSDLFEAKANSAHRFLRENSGAHQQHVKLQGLVGSALIVELVLADDLPVVLAPGVLQHILQPPSAM